MPTIKAKGVLGTSSITYEVREKPKEKPEQKNK
jgi:hypothetical protein